MLFDDIDLSKLKLPIEPQNLIYIYLAYKLINNLDKIQIGHMPGMTQPRMPTFRRPQQINGFYSLFMFLILLTFGFVIMSNLLNRISISSGTLEPLDIALKCSEMTRPIKDPTMMKHCPFKPNLFNDDYKEMLKKCPLFDSKKNVDNSSEESESKSGAVNI